MTPDIERVYRAEIARSGYPASARRSALDELDEIPLVPPQPFNRRRSFHYDAEATMTTMVTQEVQTRETISFPININEKRAA
jgi:hypothetical protein